MRNIGDGIRRERLELEAVARELEQHAADHELLAALLQSEDEPFGEQTDHHRRDRIAGAIRALVSGG